MGAQFLVEDFEACMASIEVALAPGDSISFDSTVPHCLRNIATEPTRAVWFVIGRQNDRRAAALTP